MKQKMLIFALMMLIIGGLWGQNVIYQTGFEASDGFTAGTVYNNTDILYSGHVDNQWGTYYGTPSTTAAILGNQSMQMRWYTSAISNLGYTYTNFDLANATYVNFFASSTNGLNVKASFSTDGGTTYINEELFILSITATEYTYNISATGEYPNVRIKFEISLPDPIPTGTSRLYIDDVKVYGGQASGVALPNVVPATGFYTDPQTIEITHEDNSATIYYTLNGDDPDNNSTQYTSLFQISENTTLKAIAYVGGQSSGIVTRNYTFPVVVNNLAELRTQTTGSTVYKLTGEVIVTFTQTFRNQKYVQDNSAAILIDDNSGIITSNYSIGDGISNLLGTLTTFGGMLQFVPYSDPGVATSIENTITPVIITVDQFINNFESYEAQVVTLQNMRFINTGNFATGQVYVIIDPFDIPMNFRTTFFDANYIDQPLPNQFVHITGILNSRTDGHYLTARSISDFSYDDTLPVTLSSFSAAVIASNTVSINWSTESESNLRGYHIVRSENGSLESSIRITPSMIAPHNTSVCQNYEYVDYEVYAGDSYYYWLQVIENDGTSEYFGPVSVNIPEGEVVTQLPSTTLMANVYPNPLKVNSNAIFDIKVKEGETANLKIFNVKGQLVRTFDDIKSGSRLIQWDGKDNLNRSCATGIYFYQLSSPSYHSVQKMIIVK